LHSFPRRTDEFPAFFTPHSGCAPSCRVDSPREAAAVIRAGLALHLGRYVIPSTMERAVVATTSSAQEASDEKANTATYD
jgi:pseudouridine-5'-phosphate glycosidase